jgi:D-sedoheptulose 7-phosphate isomerase
VSPERTDFLYPFIDAGERDAGPLLADLAASAEAKATESRRLAEATLGRCAAELERAARILAGSFTAGGRLFTFGNGGSATDAAGLARLFAEPSEGTPLPARSLSTDEAVLTALANDVGFDLVFARQLIAHGRRGDVAVGLSTSGNSANLLVAFAQARRRGLRTLGLAGYDGGRMASCDDLDVCLVVASDSVHRIQETQAALSSDLWSRVRRALAEVAP